MKKLLSILSLCGAMLVSHSASAEGYFGIGGSSVGGSGLTSGINLDLVAGMEINDAFAVELNFDTPVQKAKVGSTEVEIQHTAIYGAFRSNGDTYFKAKLGYHSSKVGSATRSALAYGVGVGFGDGYELEYTSLQPENSSNDPTTKISFVVMF